MDSLNLNEMKYSQLIQYCKNLGIEINNQTSKKLKKEIILEAIRAHLQETSSTTTTQTIAKMTNNSKTKSKNTNVNDEMLMMIENKNEDDQQQHNKNKDDDNNQDEKIKKTKKIIKVKKSTRKQQDSEQQETTEKKAKKSKNDKKELQEEQDEFKEQDMTMNATLNRTMTRSKANALRLNQTVLNETIDRKEQKKQQQQQEEPVKEKKKVKKVKKATSNEEQGDEKSKEVKIKKVKKVKKQETNESDPVVVEEETKLSNEKKTKKVKKIKKKDKETNENEPRLPSPLKDREQDKAQNEDDDLNENSKFKLELEEDDDETKQETNQNKSIRTQEVEQTTKTDSAKSLELTNSSLITNDEEQVNPENKQDDNNLNITRDVSNTTFDKELPEQQTTNQIPISNTLTCTSFYSLKSTSDTQLTQETTAENNKSEQQEIEKLSNQEPEQQPKPKTGGARIVRPKQVVTVVQSVKNIRDEIVAEEVTQKVVEVVRREAGPRIVKPTILTEDVATSSHDSKRKINDQNSNKTKKLKDTGKKNESTSTSSNQTEQPVKPTLKIKAAPVPDFKSIHEKEAQKMESIDSYEKRKHDRHNKLTDATTSSTVKRTSLSSPMVQPQVDGQQNAEQSTNKPKAKTPTSISSKHQPVLLSKKTPLKISNTPKFAKTLASTAGSLLSNIPRFLQSKKQTEETNQAKAKEDEVENVDSQIKTQNEESTNKNVDEPKTPDLVQKSKLLRTPSSVTKPTESSILKSAIKRNQSLKLNLNNQQTNPQQQQLLQSSSFVRRKSYDLNKSLSRPLGYNPHHGKLKPVDINTKSVFLASLAATTANVPCLENNKTLENKQPNSTTNNVLKQVQNQFNDSICSSSNSTLGGGGGGDKNLEVAKRRLSTIKLSGIRSNVETTGNRNLLSDHIKSENLKKQNEKSTQMNKKLRLEKVKQHKQAKHNEIRHLDEDIEQDENEFNLINT